MTGKIVKGIAGFYYVDVIGSGIYKCKAKGLFRKMGVKPLVGDNVDIVVTHEGDMEANIERIYPRRNELVRPAVANIDQALIVMALSQPEPNLGVLDRFLIQMQKSDIPIMICFNKADLVTEKDIEYYKSPYEAAGYETLVTSLLLEIGLNKLKALFEKKTTVLAGPSGVGKSSILNHMSCNDIMETGEISVKLKRGKNTTRFSRLVTCSEGTYICDTPGFTSFDAESIEKSELRFLFPEFKEFEGKCRFNGCVHINEPSCAVKEAVEKGKLSSLRYNSYTRLFEELLINEKNRYR